MCVPKFLLCFLASFVDVYSRGRKIYNWSDGWSSRCGNYWGKFLFFQNFQSNLYRIYIFVAKDQKLCQSQNSKWKNFAEAEYWHLFQIWSVLQIQHNHVWFHIYHTDFKCYLELNFQNDALKFSWKCLDILSSLIKLLQLFTVLVSLG